MKAKPQLLEAAERAAQHVFENHLSTWLEGAIFPSEMAFFIASCEVFGITRVIESGRQDGYSTAILADWAERSGAEIISVDLELDAGRAAACRARLRGKPVTLIKGSAYSSFGKASFSDPEKPTAFLVDGPKGWPALSMMSAALTPGTRLVAIHNLAEGLPTRDLFLRLGGPSVFYEDALIDPGPRWRTLRKFESELLTARGAVRDLEGSSLGVLALEGEALQKFSGLSGAQFGLHQPSIVRGFYRFGLFRATTKLYGLSYRLSGR